MHDDSLPPLVPVAGGSRGTGRRAVEILAGRGVRARAGDALRASGLDHVVVPAADPPARSSEGASR